MEKFYKIPNIKLLQEVIEAKKSYAKPNTIKYYVSTVTKLSAFLNDDELLIDDTVCRAFSKHLFDNMLHSSARAYLQQLAALFNDAVERGWLAASPMPKPSSLAPQPKAVMADSLSIEDVMRLYRTPCVNADLRRAFLFSCFTGLNQKQIEQIEFDHIHHNGKGLVVVLPLRHGSTSIPFSQMALRILKEVEDDYANFSSHTQKLFSLPSCDQMKSVLAQWASKAKLNTLLSFDLSVRTFTHIAMQSGINAKKLISWNTELEDYITIPQPSSGMAAFDALFVS